MSLIADRYHLLNNPLPGEWVDKLLGRVVVHKEDPTAIIAPQRDGPRGATDEDEKKSWIPQRIVPDLSDDPVPYTTLYYLLKDAKDQQATAKLTDYFHAEASRKLSTQVTITGIEVERYDISSIPERLDELMQNTAYAESVKKILRHEGKARVLGMVTGIFVSKSLTCLEEKVDGKGFAAGGKVPVSKLASDPSGTTDVAATLRTTRVREGRRADHRAFVCFCGGIYRCVIDTGHAKGPRSTEQEPQILEKEFEKD